MSIHFLFVFFFSTLILVQCVPLSFQSSYDEQREGKRSLKKFNGTRQTDEHSESHNSKITTHRNEHAEGMEEQQEDQYRTHYNETSDQPRGHLPFSGPWTHQHVITQLTSQNKMELLKRHTSLKVVITKNLQQQLTIKTQIIVVILKQLTNPKALLLTSKLLIAMEIATRSQPTSILLTITRVTNQNKMELLKKHTSLEVVITRQAAMKIATRSRPTINTNHLLMSILPTITRVTNRVKMKPLNIHTNLEVVITRQAAMKIATRSQLTIIIKTIRTTNLQLTTILQARSHIMSTKMKVILLNKMVDTSTPQLTKKKMSGGRAKMETNQTNR
ncbi:hypothetical protein M3Y95_00627100 [Aphelenchoides besseyi]|nr:hypothetical protein M3Y95_00627100 [Aphelenchoides besseyi]